MIVRFEKKSERAAIIAVCILAAVIIGIGGYAATRLAIPYTSPSEVR